MKVYTKTGDNGTTSLVGGTRISKDDRRLDAYGTIDELNSWLGLVLAYPIADKKTRNIVLVIQHRLFDIGAALATEIDSKWQPRMVSENDILALESEIDRMEEVLPQHDQFILPGGSKLSAITNIARTIARRAERIIISLQPETAPGQATIIRFINRLSDYLFVLSRYFNFLAKEKEIFWDKDCKF